MFYSFYLIILASGLLALSSLTAKADDTYNFYFQKAPGKNAVIQSSTGQTINATPDADFPSEAPAKAKPSLVAKVTTTAEEPALSTSRNLWELGIGYTNFANDTLLERPDFTLDRGNFLARPVSGQFSLHLQMNATENLGVDAALFYLNEKVHTRSYQYKAYEGRRTDFSGGIVVTPLRLKIATSLSLVLSGIGGVMSLPRVAIDINKRNIEHFNTYYYGGRASVEMGRIALQGSARGIGEVSGTLVNGTVAYLF